MTGERHTLEETEVVVVLVVVMTPCSLEVSRACNICPVSVCDPLALCQTSAFIVKARS
jgi:hypothetical protein